VRFTELELPGVWRVELEPHEDERGFFARTFCEEEFAAHGLVTRYPQGNVSYNRGAGTLRGMHYQADPHAETKLIRCVSGALHDVVVDLRAGAPTRGRWLGVELNARTRTALYVPAGFAHGFLTLQENTEVLYQMGAAHAPEAQRGFRWDDPAFGIDWPRRPRRLSERDRTWPDFRWDAPGG
jgi:dTDP-4-dehydrorhamnose 3,5-epimerase